MPGVQQGEAQPVKGCPTAPAPQDPPSSSTNSSEDPTDNTTPQPTQQIQEENKVESPEPTQQTEGNMSPEDAPSTSPLAGEEGPGPLIPQPQGGTSSPSSTSGVVLASPPVAFNLTCMTCHTHFTSAEEYTRHHCVSSESRGQQQQQLQHQQDQNDSSSDVEKFDGKIVYNPDGSAYIIDSEMSDDDCGLDLPRQEGAVVDSPGNPLSSTAAPTIPTIANAIYVTKNPAFYNALYGQTFTSLIQENKVPDVPIVHNYRVITVGDKDGQNECKDSDSKNDSSSEKTKLPLLDYSQVPIKPILMCFVCKLSFGYVKSFIAHAMGDHSIVLMDEEKDLLAGKNASAIIQCGGREKEPRVSFLEPVKPPSAGANSNNCSSSTSSSSGCNNGRPVEALAALMPSGVPSGPSSSPHLQQPSPVIKTEEQHHNATEEEHPINDAPIKREVTDFYDMVRQQQAHHLEQQRQQQQFLQQHHQHQAQLHAERFPPPPHPAAVRTPDLSRKSPISALGANGRASVSPVTSMSPTTFSPLQSPVSQLTGTIIGACPEHMNGRPHGVTCDKCDMILQSSRTIGGQMAFMHSRNSCKTLKCPKCNWHYKYQETLEIHMKEKHPDTESTCIYCLTNQAHPRLARGETYTCGYKPYRCEVCNYSTTTKGNLSIHMQSDKHLNNMQELQNGGMPLDSTLSSPGGLTQPQQSPANSIYSAPKTPTPSTTPAPSQQLQQQQQKPKPVWRCDVCNYETNVARNLRIHMTSEKHTHNMMVLQQNVKHMQQLNVLQGGGGGPGGQMDPMALLQMAGNPAAAAMMAQAAQLQGMGEKPQLPEAALADMAYSQALLIQMISGGQVPGGPMGPGRPGGPPGLGPGPVPGPGEHPGPQFDLGLNPESLEPPPEPVPPNPRHSFSCCVCSVFSTDSLEQLSLHLQMDRSKLNENEVLLVVAGNYICKLCSYKTNLKANFQLHCKTDKHLQKLQHVNHILEGGPTNEWKLKYLSNTNPMHVRCNLCEYYTNSVHKLQLHAAHQRHEVLALLFRHLCMSEQSISEERRQYHCTLCSFSTGAKVQLLHHIRSMRHLQMEQLHQIQRHAEGKGQTQQDIGDIFRVDEADEDSRRTPVHHEVKEELRSPDQVHACPFCHFTCESESGLQSHVGAEHGEEKKAGLRCPLCEEACPDMTTLEKHAIQVHSVNSDGLQRLLLLVRLSAAARKEAASSSNAGDEESGAAPVDQKPVLPIAAGGESEEGGEQQAQQDKSSSGDADERGGHDAEATEGGEKSTSDEREKEAESRSRSDSATTPTPTSRATPTPGATPTSSSAEQPGINVPQIAEMAAALNALSNSAQLQQQMQFNPMSLMANLGLAAGLHGLPMNPLAAMNLHPPLMPMMPPHMFDPAAMSGMNQGGPPTSMPSAMPEDVNPFIKQQIMQQQQQQQQAAAAAAAAAAAQQKRARTRITDDQLKVLRAHFDINNSPTEDQINDMAKQSGLPPKVIKHWFRNTLFKERQRSKDSPYNFSIPPSTTLNLEEYEKTGEAKVTALNPEEAQEIVALNRANDERLGHPKEGPEQLPSPPPPQQHSTHDIPSVASPHDKVPSLNQDNSRVQVKSEDAIGGLMGAEQHHQQLQQHSQLQMSTSPHLVSPASSSPLGLPPTTSYSSLPSPQQQLTLASLITSQLESNPMLAHKLPHTSPTVPNSGLIPPSSGVSPTPSLTYSYPTSPLGPNMGGCSSAAGKRANRTRFTDYQIKVLQEFFENNAYPKDDDLEYLSKLLNLSPRVIVVWFQNARQKARKVYENQPPIDPMDEGAGRFTRTPGLNYQCKKCLLVFQRYYELIRHQKTHCFKEEDAKRSAQAQAAAAQAAAMYQPDENSNHSSITENSQQSSGMDLKPSEENFQCDKCSLRFNRFEQWREHQIVHIMNPALFLNKGADSPFPNMQQTIQQSMQQTMQQTLQQNMQQNLQQNMQQTMPVTPNHQQQSQVGVPQPLPSPLLSPASPFKRKLEEVFSEEEREGGTPLTEAQRDKRLRTTILPEQLDYLYQKYQLEANPSRKMLETIAQEVGLKKRVVQVWFQNTRARERKGQFRAHAQVINKKCPFCPAIFKVKSALESHLSTKHTDQYNKGNLNIDALPDVEDSGVGHFGLSSTPSSTQVSQVIPSSLFSSSDIPEDSIYKYHEEAIRRYLNDVNLATDGVRRDGESPLDLSKPLGFENSLLDTSMDPADDQSDEDGVYHLEVTVDPEDGEMISYYSESRPTSPASSTTSSAKHPGNTPGGVKRYRTQMSAIQVKLMKSVFYVYKTPTMAECELLGREIGLAKRVIQVWFQNARAKEKKAKLAFQKMLGTEPEGPKPPEECKVCNFKYSHKYAIQDHIFTRSHIESMKLYLEKAKEEHDAGLGSGVGALGSGGGDGDQLPSNPAAGLAQQLQMAQLMALGSPPNAAVAAAAAAAAAASGEETKVSSNGNEDLSRLQLLQQMYQMGLGGLQGAPHPLLQHAMMAGAGE